MEIYFKNHKEHISLEELNTAYGHMGKTFPTQKEAIRYSSSLSGNSYVTRIINYKSSDVVTTSIAGVIIEGAKPHTVAWLVTPIIEEEVKIKYQGY